MMLNAKFCFSIAFALSSKPRAFCTQANVVWFPFGSLSYSFSQAINRCKQELNNKLKSANPLTSLASEKACSRPVRQ